MDVRRDGDPSFMSLVDGREESGAGDFRDDRGEKTGVRIQKVSGAVGKIKDGTWSRVLRPAKHHRQLIIAPAAKPDVPGELDIHIDN